MLTEIVDNSNQFYPTPNFVVQKMIDRLNINKGSVLEPSAGKGDIADKLKLKGYRVDCVEIDENLRGILKSKGHNVIANDFLEDPIQTKYDAIVMNPPFKNGIKHLMRAYEYLVEGGELVCLLNANNYNNTDNKYKKLLNALIDNSGSVVFLDDVFSNSERKTDIDVVMIYLVKKTGEEQFTGEFFNQNDVRNDFFYNEDNAEINNNQLVTNKQKLEDMCDCYKEGLKDMGKAFDYIQKAVQILNNPLVLSYSMSSATSDIFKEVVYSLFSNYEKDKNNVIKEVKENFRKIVNHSYWEEIAELSNFSRIMDSEQQVKFNKYIKEDYRVIDINMDNINNLYNNMFMSKEDTIIRMVKNVIQKLTSYDKKNVVHHEGWKTNKSYKVNHKVILPNIVSWSPMYNGGGHFTMYISMYGSRSILKDLDRVCALFDGKDIKNIVGIEDALKNYFNMISRDEVCKVGESTYFNMKWYKKGTLHIEFKDKYVLDRINQFMAKYSEKMLFEEN